MAHSNGNTTVSNPNASVEVLIERITNVSKRLDEQVVASQTAITVALATQEKAVNAAFLASEKALQSALSASEKAIGKSEASQAEVNKVIAELTKDVISLRESRSQNVGNKDAKTDDKQQSNFNTSLAISIGFNVLMFLGMVFKMLVK
jgi:xanthine dehydrogenase iron-sulfur cluster and FAD-binding subunit A